MSDTQISDILAKDILDEKSKYIKDGIITFDCIAFDFDEEKPTIKFYRMGDLLATMSIQSWIPGSPVLLQLTKGTMEMTISTA